MTNTEKEMANLLDKGEELLRADSQKGKGELLTDILKSALMSRLIIHSLIIHHEEREENDILETEQDMDGEENND